MFPFKQTATDPKASAAILHNDPVIIWREMHLEVSPSPCLAELFSVRLTFVRP